jgi:hypothetical protein
LGTQSLVAQSFHINFFDCHTFKAFQHVHQETIPDIAYQPPTQEEETHHHLILLFLIITSITIVAIIDINGVVINITAFRRGYENSVSLLS